MGRASRDKGKRGELEVAKLLEPVFPDARRGAAQSRRGDDAADVEGTPYWVEVKRVARQESPRAAMEQAQAATDGRPPVVFTRRDGAGWLVTMTADLALEMMIGREKLPRAGESREWWWSRVQEWAEANAVMKATSEPVVPKIPFADRD